MQQHKYYQWILLFALSLMAFLINVDYTAVNLALLPIARDFHVSLTVLQWLLTAYVLAWAIIVIPAGKYSDNFPKSRCCAFGLVLFLIASLLAGVANNVVVLIIARILQGISAALYVPAMYSLIYLHFAEQKRGKAIGIMSLGVGAGLVCGPALSGILLSLFSWRSIFFINIPIALIALIIIAADKQIEPLPQDKQVPNRIGSFLLGFALLDIIYLLGIWQTWQFHVIVCSILFVMAIVALIAFIYWQKTSVMPLIPLSLFANLSFIAIIVGMLLEQYAFSAIMVATGLYLQKVMLLTPLKCGLFYLYFTTVFGVIAALGGAWVDKAGLKLPIILGLALLCSSVVIFALFANSMNWLWLCIIFVMIGIGMGLAFAGLNTGIVKVVAVQEIGVATSVFIMSALLGNALGVSFTTMIYEKTSLLNLLHSLQSNYILSQSQLSQLASYIENIGAQIKLDSFDLSSQQNILHYTTSALSHGVSYTMLTTALVCLLAMLCCSLLRHNTNK